MPRCEFLRAWILHVFQVSGESGVSQAGRWPRVRFAGHINTNHFIKQSSCSVQSINSFFMYFGFEYNYRKKSFGSGETQATRGPGA